MNKHNPFKWKALKLNWGWQVLGEGHEVVTIFEGKTKDPRKDEDAAAKANLIAAAPELLVALEAMLDHTPQASADETAAFCKAYPTHPFALARAAIRKAQGEVRDAS